MKKKEEIDSSDVESDKDPKGEEKEESVFQKYVQEPQVQESEKDPVRDGFWTDVRQNPKSVNFLEFKCEDEEIGFVKRFFKFLLVFVAFGVVLYSTYFTFSGTISKRKQCHRRVFSHNLIVEGIYYSGVMYYVLRCLMFCCYFFAFLFRQKGKSEDPESEERKKSVLVFIISTGFSTFWGRTYTGSKKDEEKKNSAKNLYLTIAIWCYFLTRFIVGFTHRLFYCFRHGDGSAFVFCFVRKTIQHWDVFIGWYFAFLFYREMSKQADKSEIGRILRYLRSSVQYEVPEITKKRTMIWSIIFIVVVVNVIESTLVLVKYPEMNDWIKFLNGLWRNILFIFSVKYCYVALSFLGLFFISFYHQSKFWLVLVFIRGLLSYFLIMSIHRALFILLYITILIEIGHREKKFEECTNVLYKDFQKESGKSKKDKISSKLKLKSIEVIFQTFNGKFGLILHYVIIDRILYPLLDFVKFLQTKEPRTCLFDESEPSFALLFFREKFGINEKIVIYSCKHAVYFLFICFILFRIIKFNNCWGSFVQKFREIGLSIVSEEEYNFKNEKSLRKWKVFSEYLKNYESNGIKLFGYIVESKMIWGFATANFLLFFSKFIGKFLK